MGLAPQVWGSPPERKPREHFEPAAKQGPLRVMRRTAGGYSRAFRHHNPTLPPVCVSARARVCVHAVADGLLCARAIVYGDLVFAFACVASSEFLFWEGNPLLY